MPMAILVSMSSSRQNQRPAVTSSYVRIAGYHRGIKSLSRLGNNGVAAGRASSASNVSRNVPRPVQTSSLRKENGGQDVNAVLVNRHGSGKTIGWGSAVPAAAPAPANDPNSSDPPPSSGVVSKDGNLANDGVHDHPHHHPRQDRHHNPPLPPPPTEDRKNVPWALHPPSNPPTTFGHNGKGIPDKRPTHPHEMGGRGDGSMHYPENNYRYDDYHRERNYRNHGYGEEMQRYPYSNHSAPRWRNDQEYSNYPRRDYAYDYDVRNERRDSREYRRNDYRDHVPHDRDSPRRYEYRQYSRPADVHGARGNYSYEDHNSGFYRGDDRRWNNDPRQRMSYDSYIDRDQRRGYPSDGRYPEMDRSEYGRSRVRGENVVSRNMRRNDESEPKDWNGNHPPDVTDDNRNGDEHNGGQAVENGDDTATNPRNQVSSSLEGSSTADGSPKHAAILDQESDVGSAKLNDCAGSGLSQEPTLILRRGGSNRGDIADEKADNDGAESEKLSRPPAASSSEHSLDDGRITSPAKAVEKPQPVLSSERTAQAEVRSQRSGHASAGVETKNIDAKPSQIRGEIGRNVSTESVLNQSPASKLARIVVEPTERTVRSAEQTPVLSQTNIQDTMESFEEKKECAPSVTESSVQSKRIVACSRQTVKTDEIRESRKTKELSTVKEETKEGVVLLPVSDQSEINVRERGGAGKALEQQQNVLRHVVASRKQKAPPRSFPRRRELETNKVSKRDELDFTTTSRTRILSDEERTEKIAAMKKLRAEMRRKRGPRTKGVLFRRLDDGRLVNADLSEEELARREEKRKEEQQRREERRKIELSRREERKKEVARKEAKRREESARKEAKRKDDVSRREAKRKEEPPRKEQRRKDDVVLRKEVKRPEEISGREDERQEVRKNGSLLRQEENGKDDVHVDKRKPVEAVGGKRTREGEDTRKDRRRVKDKIEQKSRNHEGKSTDLKDVAEDKAAKKDFVPAPAPAVSAWEAGPPAALRASTPATDDGKLPPESPETIEKDPSSTKPLLSKSSKPRKKSGSVSRVRAVSKSGARIGRSSATTEESGDHVSHPSNASSSGAADEKAKGGARKKSRSRKLGGRKRVGPLPARRANVSKTSKHRERKRQAESASGEERKEKNEKNETERPALVENPHTVRRRGVRVARKRQTKEKPSVDSRQQPSKLKRGPRLPQKRRPQKS